MRADCDNFGNSGANDVLYLLLKHIVSEIRRAFELDSTNSLYDDLGEGLIMGNIDILLTLCQHYKVRPTLTDVAEIITWKKNYLATFDRTVHNYNVSEEFVKARRRVISKTFNKLQKLVEDMNLL